MDLLLFLVMCDFDTVFVRFSILVRCILNENEFLLHERCPHIPS